MPAVVTAFCVLPAFWARPTCRVGSSQPCPLCPNAVKLLLRFAASGEMFVLSVAITSGYPPYCSYEQPEHYEFA